MTDIEALRARMREAAVAVENAGDDLGLFSERHGEFQRLASPANVKALDAEITRLREDLDRVTRERDEAGKTPEVLRLIARAEAAEAALAKRDEEVARLMTAMDREEAYLHRMIDASEENGGIMHGDLEGAFHRIRDKDSDDAERAEALTQEPTNAER